MLFGVLAAGLFAIVVVARDELELQWSLTIAGAGALLLAAAIRSWFMRIVLSPAGVAVHAMCWTKRVRWTQVRRFADVTITSGFGSVTSPFLVIDNNGEDELVALPLLRPAGAAFESR